MISMISYDDHYIYNFIFLIINEEIRCKETTGKEVGCKETKEVFTEESKERRLCSWYVSAGLGGLRTIKIKNIVTKADLRIY